MITDYMGQGVENALSATALAEMIGSTPGDVYVQIQQARKDGWLIIGKPGPGGGYFLPRYSTDYYDFCSRLEKRIYRLISTYTTAMCYASQIEPHSHMSRLCESYSRKTRKQMHEQIDEAHKARIERRCEPDG